MTPLDCVSCQAIKPCTGCNAQCARFTSPSGSFSDGSGSDQYPHNADCKWIISPPAAEYVTLAFTSFVTEYGYDKVHAYVCADQECASKQELTPAEGLSGALTGLSYASSSGVMLITFSSDSSVNRAGFEASWTSSTV